MDCGTISVDWIEVSSRFERLGIRRCMIEMLHEKVKSKGVVMSTMRPGIFRNDGDKNVAADGRSRSVVFWEKMGYEIETDALECVVPKYLRTIRKCRVCLFSLIKVHVHYKNIKFQIELLEPLSICQEFTFCP